MTKVGVLYSGGKDSSLAAILLSRDYEVELNTYVFSEEPAHLSGVERAATSLGFPWRVRVFSRELLSAAIDSILARGNPSEAISMVHKSALHDLAIHYGVVADGTRFDDRVPMLSRDEAQSLQDTRHCSYVRPLLGYPRREVDRLAALHLRVILGETGTLENGDYEVELREAIRSRGMDVSRFFPRFHEQSLVVGLAGP
ncbi:MAG: alpha hydrolase [Methanolinea sp.]|nr:alpha hydrolase [Methanolinea sp.]